MWSGGQCDVKKRSIGEFAAPGALPQQSARIRPRRLTRAIAVERIRARLLRNAFPRTQMFVLVSLTGLAGFGASAAMLAAGLETMGLRYLLAMVIAYIVFLSLLWAWLRTSPSDYLDGIDGNQFGTNDAGGAPHDFSGGGGTFDGGGASANVDFGAKDSTIDVAGAHVDDGIFPVTIVLLAVGLALSALFVIWSAPILFAEILVDALLAAGLYRRLRLLDPRHWMIAAVRRTIIPFVLTTIVVTGSGYAMQIHTPGARSLGEVVARHTAG
jgi:hypothetical protein